MSDEQAVTLTPTETRDVDFYGDRLVGALVYIGDEAQIYVPIRPICERLGIDWAGQYQRIKRDEVLNEALRTVRIERGEFVGVTPTNSRRGNPNSVCLPLRLLLGFLFGISADRVKDEAVRAKLIIYRRECYDVLWNAFKHAILPQTTAITPAQPGGAQLAYELATAVANLAREQMEAEQRLGGRIDNMARWAKGTDARITALELRLDPQEPISDAQAAELALAVKNVAHALGQRGVANSYQRVYAELYRRFAVSSYKAMPRSRLTEALEWLRSWLGELGTNESE